MATLAEKLGAHRSTVWRLVTSSFSPVYRLLEDATPGAPQVDLARLVLDLDELVRLPAIERTVPMLEKIRACGVHRNQFARMASWCARFKISLTKNAELDADNPLIEINAEAVRRVLNKKVIAKAVKIQFEAQRRAKGRDKHEGSSAVRSRPGKARRG